MCRDNNMEIDDSEEITKYFLQLEQDYINNFYNALEKYEIHIMYKLSTEYLYKICDWLVEISKIKKNLFGILCKVFKTFLKGFYGFAPVISTYFYSELFNKSIVENILKTKDLNLNIDCFKNIMKNVLFLRKVKSIDGAKILIKDSEYSDIYKFLIKCEVGHINTNLVYGNMELEVKIEDKDKLFNKIKATKLEIERIDKFLLSDQEKMPQELLNQRKIEKKEKLEDLQCFLKLI